MCLELSNCLNGCDNCSFWLGSFTTLFASRLDFLTTFTIWRIVSSCPKYKSIISLFCLLQGHGMFLKKIQIPSLNTKLWTTLPQLGDVFNVFYFFRDFVHCVENLYHLNTTTINVFFKVVHRTLCKIMLHKNYLASWLFYTSRNYKHKDRKYCFIFDFQTSPLFLILHYQSLLIS